MNALKESSGETWKFLTSMLGMDGWTTPLSGHFTPGKKNMVSIVKEAA
jgi:hypothetical protein